MWLENGSLLLIRGVVHRMHWGETLISNPAKVIYEISNKYQNVAFSFLICVSDSHTYRLCQWLKIGLGIPLPFCQNSSAIAQCGLIAL